MSNSSIVLPRPGATISGEPRSIQAPSEAAFVETFGSLLPAASYMQTPHGRAAYYELSPSSPAPMDCKNPVTRVLFLHGVQTPAIGLQPLASVLSSQFPYAQCVLVDLWGHGLTETPLLPHDATLFHSLVNALLEHLEWDNAHFVGYSFGASTTASFAAAYPERVASIVLVAPAGLIHSTQFDDVQRSYLRGGEDIEDRAREWIVEWLEGGKLVVPSDWKERVQRGEVVAEAVREWQTKEHKGHTASVVGIVRDGGVLNKHADFAEAAKTNIRSLCILGELDDLCSVQDLKDIGMHNVYVVPQVGHGVVRQEVAEVARLIEEFWRTI
ncbi:hypothetical protein N7523_007877 [Penicillium sp. IBT 18751x]|nr:hypothetical protein N7523_007877 [Penicillium sp. IBT 18751x]